MTIFLASTPKAYAGVVTAARDVSFLTNIVNLKDLNIKSTRANKFKITYII
jgi:hypothetical protein